MGPTSESAGDNISNVARGLMAIPQEHRAFMMQQLMAPFSIANNLSELNKKTAEAEMNRGKAQMLPSHLCYVLVSRGSGRYNPRSLLS